MCPKVEFKESGVTITTEQWSLVVHRVPCRDDVVSVIVMDKEFQVTFDHPMLPVDKLHVELAKRLEALDCAAQ